jgi:low density lipoprotein receptor-related protein 5/6
VAQLISVLSVDSIMFWTDFGVVTKIERAGMNGDPATRKVIVQEK